MVQFRVLEPFFSLGPRIIFPLGSRAKKTMLPLLFKTNGQFSLSLTIFIQKYKLL
jgi:hypothetical protein